MIDKIVGAKERLLPTIATLRRKMRQSENNHACNSGNGEEGVVSDVKN